MTTINILSLPTFTDFIKTLMDLRAKHNTSFEYNRVPLSVNYLRWPPHLQCSLLDTKERVKYANDIETICNSWLKYNSPEKFARLYLEEWDQIKRFCEYLKTQTNAVEHRKDFVKFISEYDKRRSKDFYITFKDYENLMETWSA